ncbi:MAG: hypothetical protein R3D25_07455 [Geminicoccaceae bacterium]
MLLSGPRCLRLPLSGTLEIDTFTTYSLAIGALVSLNAFQFAGLYQFQHLTQLAEQARRLLLAWPRCSACSCSWASPRACSTQSRAAGWPSGC